MLGHQAVDSNFRYLSNSCTACGNLKIHKSIFRQFHHSETMTDIGVTEGVSVPPLLLFYSKGGEGYFRTPLLEAKLRPWWLMRNSISRDRNLAVSTFALWYRRCTDDLSVNLNFGIWLRLSRSCCEVTMNGGRRANCIVQTSLNVLSPKSKKTVIKWIFLIAGLLRLNMRLLPTLYTLLWCSLIN